MIKLSSFLISCLLHRAAQSRMEDQDVAFLYLEPHQSDKDYLEGGHNIFWEEGSLGCFCLSYDF